MYVKRILFSITPCSCLTPLPCQAPWPVGSKGIVQNRACALPWSLDPDYSGWKMAVAVLNFPAFRSRFRTDKIAARKGCAPEGAKRSGARRSRCTTLSGSYPCEKKAASGPGRNSAPCFLVSMSEPKANRVIGRASVSELIGRFPLESESRSDQSV